MFLLLFLSFLLSDGLDLGDLLPGHPLGVVAVLVLHRRRVELGRLHSIRLHRIGVLDRFRSTLGHFALGMWDMNHFNTDPDPTSAMGENASGARI